MQTCLAGKRVLVVEDNPTLAYNLDDVLSEHGVEVVGPALDLPTGLRLAQNNNLDDAVLDIDIAGEAVWPVARELQDHRVPFVFVSGDCHKGLPDDLGGAVCLSKPASASAVLETVSALIDAR